MALINCTECGKEISDKADKCPNCGAPVKNDSVYVSRPTGQITPQPKKKSNKGKIIAIVVVVIILIGLFGGSDESENNTSSSDDIKTEVANNQNEVKKTENNNSNKKEEEKEEKTIYNVGDVYDNKFIKMKYVDAYEFTDYESYNAPKDGYMIICAEFEVENISDSDQTVMYTDFNGYADGYEVEQSYAPEGTGMDFSLNLSAGRKGKGIVAFEVPVDSSEIQIEFSPNFWTSEKVVFSYK